MKTNKQQFNKQNETSLSYKDGTAKQVNRQIAVKVNNVSKIFKIPHTKIDSMRSMFVNMYKKKTYEKFNALKNISFEVRKGEFLGIIGHNGAGKSTLLKILAGVYQPSEGSIEVNGLIAPFLELGIGFNPELSGRDNVYLNATVLGLSKKQIDKKYQEIVEFAELENFMDEQLKNYSSGMQARLAFSVSIHADREILLMDEVLAVGDNRFSEKCLRVFKSYKNQGKTVVLVTHSIGTVQEYCDRALLLDKGEIVSAGDVKKVCDEYIYRNMTEDERRESEKKIRIEKEDEKRLQKARKQQNIKEQNKQMSIVDLKLFDRNGNELMQITKGNDFSVEVVVDVKNKNKRFVLAVQIFDNSNDVFLCGNNTLEDKFDCNWVVGKNIFKINFENTMFNTGQIYIKAIIFDNNNVIDVKTSKELNNDIIEIKKQDGSGGGVLRIEHKWKKYE